MISQQQLIRKIKKNYLKIFILFLFFAFIYLLNRYKTNNANDSDYYNYKVFSDDEDVDVDVGEILKENEIIIDNTIYPPSHNKQPTEIKLKSYCACRSSLTIKKHRKNLFETDNYFISFNKSSNGYRVNKLDGNKHVHVNPRFTCQLYNNVRRGPNQKVLAYSITNLKLNYQNVERAVQNVQDIYPDWIVRVYYDKVAHDPYVCELECKYDNVEFCDLKEIPFKQSLFNYFAPRFRTYIRNDLSFMNSQMWRWIPVADDFVDFYSSRNIESSIIQREKDSVDAWLSGNFTFHIMRDNPYHSTNIVSGLWGMANCRDRKAGYSIFDKMIDLNIQSLYKSDADTLEYDKIFLSNYIWPIANGNATIHDSYYCMRYGGEPFPTRREFDTNCYVACNYPCCDENRTPELVMPECPVQCRPKDHSDWNRC